MLLIGDRHQDKVPNTGMGDGAVYVYTMVSSSYSIAQILLPPPSMLYFGFGLTVVSTTMFVTNANYAFQWGGTGAVYVFTSTTAGGLFTLQQTMVPISGTACCFGQNLASTATTLAATYTNNNGNSSQHARFANAISHHLSSPRLKTHTLTYTQTHCICIVTHHLTTRFPVSTTRS